MRLNLGCGNQIPEGWVNVDYSMGARFSKIPLFKILNKHLKLFNLNWDEKIFLHNLTKPFPWPNGSVDFIYSSHTLEHFTKEEGRGFLSECYRVLKPDGIIRIIVPDLKHLVENYSDGKLRADNFVKELGVLFLEQNGFIKNKLAPFIQFPHKCMYDTDTLVNVLNETGFSAHACEAFNSNIPNIRKVELESRTNVSAITEGVK